MSASADDEFDLEEGEISNSDQPPSISNSKIVRTLT